MHHVSVLIDPQLPRSAASRVTRVSQGLRSPANHSTTRSSAAMTASAAPCRLAAKVTANSATSARVATSQPALLTWKVRGSGGGAPVGRRLRLDGRTPGVRRARSSTSTAVRAGAVSMTPPGPMAATPRLGCAPGTPPRPAIPGARYAFAALVESAMSPVRGAAVAIAAAALRCGELPAGGARTGWCRRCRGRAGRTARRHADRPARAQHLDVHRPAPPRRTSVHVDLDEDGAAGVDEVAAHARTAPRRLGGRQRGQGRIDPQALDPTGEEPPCRQRLGHPCAGALADIQPGPALALRSAPVGAVLVGHSQQPDPPAGVQALPQG